VLQKEVRILPAILVRIAGVRHAKSSPTSFRRANGRFATGNPGGPGRPRKLPERPGRLAPFSPADSGRNISWLQRLVRAAVSPLHKNGENGRKR
jgi:hypothetical protein